MIYLNYEKYNLAEDQSYKELKEYCDKLGYPIILKRNTKFIKKVPKIISGKPAGNRAHLAGKFFDYNYTERSAGGSNLWRYSLHPIKKDKEGYPEFEGDHGEFLNTLTLVFGEHDLEKLWFLLKKSNIVEGRGIYSIYDPEKEYRERAEKESDSIGVKFYIMAKESPLSMHELKVIAKHFGIAHVDDMSDAKLKTTLFDHVDNLQKNKQDGYKRFMAATKVDRFVTMKADLQESIDKGIIGWMPRNLTWNWLSKDGEVIDSICQLNSQDEKHKLDVLMDFMLVNEPQMQRLQREINKEEKPLDEVDFAKLKRDKDDDGYSYKELQELAKVVPGFTPVGKSYGDIVKRLLEFYS